MHVAHAHGLEIIFLDGDSDGVLGLSGVGLTIGDFEGECSVSLHLPDMHSPNGTVLHGVPS